MTLAEHVSNWRRLMATTPVEVRGATFRRAAAHFASLSTTGKLRATAMDELVNMAVAHGFGDGDEVQAIIARAFQHNDGAKNGKPNGMSFRPGRNGNLYSFPDEGHMEQRQWLHAGHYIRGAVSTTIAPGAFGKTTLLLFEALTMGAAGIRVWYISGEDPRAELDRRIAAHCRHHNINGRRDILPNLLVDDQISFGLMLDDGDWLEQLARQITLNAVDVVMLDPFVSFHNLPENDNAAMGALIKELTRIAQTAKCAIEISHHSRKVLAGNELTVDDSRGGSAIVNAARSARVCNRMSQDDAALAQISAENRSAYIRVDSGKRNMAPAEKARWWRLVPVQLANGDNVASIEPYEFPNAFAAVSSAEVDWVQTFLRAGGPRRASSQSPDWLGHHLGQRCGRNDTHEKGGAIWANRILGAWCANKVIQKVQLRDPVSHKMVPFYAGPDFKGPE
jgi:hypothetical protein